MCSTYVSVEVYQFQINALFPPNCSELFLFLVGLSRRSHTRGKNGLDIMASGEIGAVCADLVLPFQVLSLTLLFSLSLQPRVIWWCSRCTRLVKSAYAFWGSGSLRHCIADTLCPLSLPGAAAPKYIHHARTKCFCINAFFAYMTCFMSLNLAHHLWRWRIAYCTCSRAHSSQQDSVS